MTPSKGHYSVGQAYVAFSRVTQLDKLHIINYTRKQIHFSHHAEKEMEKEIYLLHLNIGNLKSRLKDIEMHTIMKYANIISLNETHFGEKNTLTLKTVGIIQNVSIF